MSTIEQIVDVAVPVRVAYDQWTQFEDFPKFMEGVDRIDQVTPTRTHWNTSIAGVRREFDAEITEQRPDECIVWHTLGTPRQAGVVSFQPLDPVNTRVVLQMQFIPEGVVEQVGDKLNLVESRVKGDLQRFKEFVEEHGRSTGGWRGSVGTDPTPGFADATTPDLRPDARRPASGTHPAPDGLPAPGDRPAPGAPSAPGAQPAPGAYPAPGAQNPAPGAQQPAPGPYPTQDPRGNPGSGF
ncbi:SRPBCC family protein [Actinocorallia populi]|uniref:SRPBCC family protein n=1 Tax=Actinocorallia populi TaxID=2079200 RepID=UPI001E59D9CB|nr:SRPBCC family protein [Actinocorallia populi]